MKEYEFLRAEILSHYDSVRQYDNMLYTAVAAILAFTFDSKHFLVCMVPYIAIISLFYMAVSKNKAICKIGTYLSVFLEEEGGDYNWENRHFKYDSLYIYEKEPPFHWKSLIKYYMMSLACSVISIYKLSIDTNYSIKYKVCASLIILAFTLLIWFLFSQNAFYYEKERDEMIENWKMIKENEKIGADRVKHKS